MKETPRIPKSTSTPEAVGIDGKKEPMKIYFSDEVKLKVQTAAEAEGKSQSKFIEDVVISYLDGY
jgi:hypothetical protein